LLSFGRHLSSGRGHSVGTLGVAKPRKGADHGPRVETRQKGVSSVEEGELLRCRGVRRGMEDPGASKNARGQEASDDIATPEAPWASSRKCRLNWYEKWSLRATRRGWSSPAILIRYMVGKRSSIRKPLHPIQRRKPPFNEFWNVFMLF